MSIFFSSFIFNLTDHIYELEELEHMYNKEKSVYMMNVKYWFEL